MKVLRLFIAFLLISVCGCATNYYYSKAVGKARTYALQQMPELSEKAKYTVKYTPPRILQKRILAREGLESDSKKDVMQSCIVWPHPDQEGVYIVVAGAGERRMDDWSPIRVIIKKIDDLEGAEKSDKNDKGDFGGPSTK